MARASFIVAAIAVALAMVFHFAAASCDDLAPSTIVVTIQNNFPTYNLTVQCDSDMQGYPDLHLVLPKDAYMLHFDGNVQHQWTCTLSTEKVVDNNLCYTGKFIMWQNHMPLPPMREPMCDHKYPWFVDAKGLSLIRHPRSKPAHIYDWPTYNHHC